MSSISKMRKRPYRVPDRMRYNRAELMRAQAMGQEFEINPPPKPQPMPARPVKPATVTINNLNINTANDEKEESPAKTEEEEKEKYEPKEDMKRIQVRHKQHWFTVMYKNADEFYEFLDNFCIFGLLAEENGCLIITNYDDLIGGDAKYRTVKFNQLDKWKPESLDKESKEYKKFYSDQNMVKTKGVCSKNEKTIGIRHKFIWLQLTLRFEWEFDKLLFDAGVYGLVDEHTSLVVRKFEDLEVSDYRLFEVREWDKYNDPDEDGKTFSGTVQVNDGKGAKPKPSNNKKKVSKKETSSGWFSSSSK